MAMDFYHIELTKQPLTPPSLGETPRSGACMEFRGIVRDTENKTPILGLHYEIHPRMAKLHLERLGQRACEHFPLHGLDLRHRFGRVTAGETSLFLRVLAERRKAAFEATEWIVEELKRCVPIWKSPIYTPDDDR